MNRETNTLEQCDEGKKNPTNSTST